MSNTEQNVMPVHPVEKAPVTEFRGKTLAEIFETGNIILGGDFESGMPRNVNGEGTFSANAPTIQSDVSAPGAHALKVDAKEQSMFIALPKYSFEAGHTYYVAYRARVDEYTQGALGVQTFKNSYAPTECTADAWVRISAMQAKTSTALLKTYIGCMKTSAVDNKTPILVGYIDNVTILDLTGIFGPGNEPGKGQMDELYDSYIRQKLEEDKAKSKPNSQDMLRLPFRLRTGEVVRLTPPPSEGVLRYRSSNASVASVLQNGKVIGNGPGYAEISLWEDNQLVALAAFDVAPGRALYPVLFNRYQQVDQPVDKLVLLSSAYAMNGQRIYLCRKAVADFRRMCDEAKADGIYIVARHGYRNVSRQTRIVNFYTEKEGKSAAMARCAPPRFSEHHTGIAIDVTGGNIQEGEIVWNPEAAYAWIGEHCHEYGFMIKNLAGAEHITGTMYEPWHIRYLGDLKVAKDLHDRRLTLDEYLDETVQVARELTFPEDPAGTDTPE